MPAQQGVVVTPEGSMSTFLQQLHLAHLEGSLAEGGITTIEELLEVQGERPLTGPQSDSRSQSTVFMGQSNVDPP